MTEEEKKTITREKYPGRVAQGDKLAALVNKSKGEILWNKEQSTGQSTVQPTVQPTVQSTIQSNGAYVYGFGSLAVLAIGVCVFFPYKTSQAANKQQNEEQQPIKPPKRRHAL